MSNQAFWQEKISIGGHVYPRFMGAPLDGITDSPMRQLIRDFSQQELLFTEMRHVDCVAHEKDNRSLRYNHNELPLTFQVSANRTQCIEKAVEKIFAAGFTSLNLNAACPAPAVVKSGSGSALMGNIPQLTNVIEELLRVINGQAPLSIKIRAGFKEKNASTIAQLAQDFGLAAIIIHPRTQPERFAARLDYELVKTIKQRVAIPVIFSGNITSFAGAQKVHEHTGCDGFMIGRALWGAPWKLKEITDAAAGKTFTIDIPTILQCAWKHLNLNATFYGQHGYAHFKKQLSQYIRYIPKATEWRNILLRTQSEDEMRKQLQTLMQEQGAWRTL